MSQRQQHQQFGIQRRVTNTDTNTQLLYRVLPPPESTL